MRLLKSSRIVHVIGENEVIVSYSVDLTRMTDLGTDVILSLLVNYGFCHFWSSKFKSEEDAEPEYLPTDQRV